MKRKEKAAVDEFVALVGGKTWEPVRHKCMGKWSGMTDYGFVIDGRITLFVSNSMAYFKKLSIPYDLTPLFNNAITSFSCIIEHLCLS